MCLDLKPTENFFILSTVQVGSPRAAVLNQTAVVFISTVGLKSFENVRHRLGHVLGCVVELCRPLGRSVEPDSSYVYLNSRTKEL